MFFEAVGLHDVFNGAALLCDFQLAIAVGPLEGHMQVGEQTVLFGITETQLFREDQGAARQQRLTDTAQQRQALFRGDKLQGEIQRHHRRGFKFQRQDIALTGKRILDVGCGNGYYMWRMLGAGAHSVIGVDPNWLFFCQFQAVQRFLQQEAAWHLPFPFEDLPANLEGFDTVFSMGVFYHRRSPIEHLLALKDCLVKGGELVLETLVIEGDENQVLVPEDRYAQMRNVWFLPSIAALERWLRRAGFSEVRCVDVSITTVQEQRATPWMKFQSLSDYLDPNDHSKTIEGLPAPMRAVIVARK